MAFLRSVMKRNNTAILLDEHYSALDLYSGEACMNMHVYTCTHVLYICTCICIVCFMFFDMYIHVHVLVSLFQVMVLECQNEDGTWQRTTTQTSYNSAHPINSQDSITSSTTR